MQYEIHFMMEVKAKRLTEKELLAITNAPGAQYILVNENEIIEECNAGYADVVVKTPVTYQTTFNNFSVTKTATAAAIMRLAEKKKILLSDFVNPPFTIQHLLTHQAGFGDPVPISWIHLPEEENTFNENNFITQTVQKFLNQKFVPGSKFSYSSVGYLLLSQIIEKVSGEAYSSYVLKNIVSTLNEKGSLGFTIKDQSLHATGYHRRF